MQPQKYPMQNYSFAPPNMGVGTDKKSTYFTSFLVEDTHLRRLDHGLIRDLDYVFVDEHNRHKRLKGEPATTVAVTAYC